MSRVVADNTITSGAETRESGPGELTPCSGVEFLDFFRSESLSLSDDFN